MTTALYVTKALPKPKAKGVDLDKSKKHFFLHLATVYVHWDKDCGICSNLVLILSILQLFFAIIAKKTECAAKKGARMGENALFLYQK